MKTKSTKVCHTREWQVPDLVHADPAAVKWAKELVAQAQKNLRVAERALATAQKDNAQIKCCACGNVYPIKDQVYIQTHWYTEPHGCTGGDYWNAGEANWDCPGCGFHNRFDARQTRESGGDWMNRPELVELMDKFKKIHNCYCRRSYDGYQRRCDYCEKAGMKGRY